MGGTDLRLKPVLFQYPSDTSRVFINTLNSFLLSLFSIFTLILGKFTFQ